MTNRQFPTTGTAGGLHHEKESFRSGWGKARGLIESRVYHGDMPTEDAVLLTEWYSIRMVLFQKGNEGKGKFEQEKNEFNAAIPENASDQLLNALKLITGYMSRNGNY